MSDLEAAIAAEMKRQGCRRLPVGSPIYDCDTCREHLDVWIDDACEVVAAAVRAGWNAAINAAAEKTTPTYRVDPDEPVTDPNFAALIGANRALWGASERIHALLSEGGDRD